MARVGAVKISWAPDRVETGGNRAGSRAIAGFSAERKL